MPYIREREDCGGLWEGRVAGGKSVGPTLTNIPDMSANTEEPGNSPLGQDALCWHPLHSNPRTSAQAPAEPSLSSTPGLQATGLDGSPLGLCQAPAMGTDMWTHQIILSLGAS